jgi:cytochrome P450
MSINNTGKGTHSAINYVDKMILAKNIISNPHFGTINISSYLVELENNCGIDLSDLKDFCDSSLVFQSGKDHLDNRRAISSFFSTVEIAKWEFKIREDMNTLLSKLDPIKHTDLLQSYADPIYLLIIREIIGVDINDPKDFLKEVVEAKSLTEPLQSIKKIQKIQNSIVKIINRVRITYDKKESTSINMIQRLKQNPKFDDQKNIINLAVSLIIAAHTTTETLIIILYHFLNNKASLWKKAADIEWLEKRIDGFIRLYPTTQFIARRTVENTQLLNSLFEEAGIIRINVSAVNRDPLFTPEEDLLSGEEERKCPFNHMSFGGGIHKCPGVELARMILINSISSLAIRFPNIELMDPELALTRLLMIAKPKSLNVSINS